MRKELTRRQKEVYEALQGFIDENNYAPAFRELGEIVGLKSSSTISEILCKLRSKGYVDWKEGQPRTIHVIKTAV